MSQPTPRMLVVYYSRTGHTALLAQAIAQAAAAEREQLREREPRGRLLGGLRASYEGLQEQASELLPLEHQPADYDIVFIGSPSWGGALSSPVRGFLGRHAEALRDTALFATQVAPGSTRAVEQMARMLPRPPLASLVLLESEVRHGPAVWVGELIEKVLLCWEAKQGIAQPTRSAQISGRA